MKFVSKILKLPVLMQLLQLILLSLVSGYLFSLRRLEFSIVLGIVAPLITVLLLNYFYKNKKVERSIEAILISLGLIVLVKSWNLYFYGVISSITIIVYSFMRRNSHLLDYNPINLAIILGILFFPLTSLHMPIGFFTFSSLNLLISILIGLVFLFSSKSWPIAFSYMITILIWGVVDSLVFKESFFYWFSTELGFSGIVFITLVLINSNELKDFKAMLLFGAMVAIFKIVLKSNEYFYPSYLSLFIVSTLFNLNNQIKSKSI